MDSHLFGDNSDAADDRKIRQDTFRAKHADVLDDDDS